MKKESIQSHKKASAPDAPPLSTDGIDIYQWPVYVNLKKGDNTGGQSPKGETADATGELTEIMLSAWDFAGIFQRP